VSATQRRRWVEPAPRAGYRGAPTGADPARKGIPALDGLRAVAVGLVLVAHGGIPGVSGGFIGVDLFFVLSGFLITALLIDELGRTGRIDLADFWVRRARRLLPALVVMVLAVVLLRAAFAPDSVVGLRQDAVTAFFWVANWGLIAQHTDYFTEGGEPSPLQHTWSLGVEEQYYLVWPLIVVGTAVALAIWARRRRGTDASLRTVRFTIAAVAGTGAVGSAVAAVLMASHTSVNRVYFGTDTRAQALLIGAAAAALLVRDWPALTAGWSTVRSRWARVVLRVLPVLGLAALAILVHRASGDADDFRHGLLTMVALAAVTVIAPVALDQNGLVGRALAWGPLVWLGAISYGIYLWHWPVFLIVDGERTHWSGWTLFAARCGITVALAAVSWWVIEQPIRRWRPVAVPSLRLAAAVVATAAVLTLQIVPTGLRPGDPDLPPGVSTAAVERVVDPVEVARPGAVAPRAPGERVVTVFGDSIGWTLMRYLPATPGLKFVDRTTIGCGVARGGPYEYYGERLEQKPECDAWPSRWAQRIAYDRPDVAVLVIGRWEIMDRVYQGKWTHIGDPTYDIYLEGELRRALDTVGSTGAKVVVTTEPFNRRGEQPDGTLYPEDEPDRVNKWNTLLRRVAADYPNVSVLDLNKKLGPRGVYTSKINGIQVRSDGVHLTPEGVKWLTPWLLDAVNAPAAPAPIKPPVPAPAKPPVAPK
jgi:peptidoglycan/LPS O-acetylase OafA/YrhL